MPILTQPILFNTSAQQLASNGQLKLFVSLKTHSDQEYKKLTLLIDANSRISELKRQIEKEFGDLFPLEPPFVVAKIDDE